MHVDKMIKRAMPYSKCGVRRLRATAMACEQVNINGVSGVFVECGVWRGGNVMVARWASPLRQCWLYDTFTGMTEPGPFDKHRNGKLAHDHWPGKAAVSAVEVFGNLLDVRAIEHEHDHINFIEGDVRQTLRIDSNLPDQIAILRLDTDFYDSTKIEMEVLYPRLAVGGILIVDDYGHWMGARKAVDDYLGKSAKLNKIDKTGVWMVKEK